MRLSDYLAREALTAAEFGRRIGRGKSAVSRWAKGERIPDRESMGKIKRATGGRVTANDFYPAEAA
jgi:DNA-binding transcriptional regulator YdaS (Cro superfamily)